MLYKCTKVVDRAAEMYGEREGLVVTHQHIRRDYIQLQREINSLAAGFIDLGLEPGDRVSVASDWSILMSSHWSGWYLGAQHPSVVHHPVRRSQGGSDPGQY